MYLKKLSKTLLISLNKAVYNSYDKRLLSLGVIGAPTSVGQCKSGVELGPKFLRSSGLIKHIQDLEHNVIDFGDISEMKITNALNQNSVNNKLKNEYEIQAMYLQLQSLVHKVVNDNRIPITLGGDHSIAMGSISANADNIVNGDDMCVLWIDAHADINTVKTTRTGHFHGMPLSFLIRQIEHTFNNPNGNYLKIKPCLNANSIGFIGLRDVESSEIHMIEKLNICYYSTQDMDRIGINEVIARTLDRINPKLDKRIHISFDVDAIDQSIAPSTGTPVPGGLTLREAFCIGEEIFKTNKLCGLDFVELNPMIGNESDVKKTMDCALNVILSFLGKSRINFIKS